MNERSVAVVTGASTGIGAATALRLAHDGHHVVAGMRDPEQAAFGDVDGLALETAALDVLDDASVAACFEQVLDTHGRIDVLVNNAGISVGHTLEDSTLDEFQSVMDTNLYGTIRCTQAVLPTMRAQGSGWVVAVTSQAGRLPVPGMAPYVASKWATEGVIEAMAGEVAELGIRVLLIEPGAILTPIIGKSVPPPDGTAYQRTHDRFLAAALHDFGHGSEASVVADCISDAMAAETTVLRHAPGMGAERNLRVRASMSDEDYLALNLLEPDDYLAAILGHDD